MDRRVRPKKDFQLIRPITSDYSILNLLHNCNQRDIRLSAKSAGFKGETDIVLASPLPSPSSPQKNEALGLFYVGESARKHGFKVEYWDARHENENRLWKKVSGANIIGFTAITGFQLGEFVRLANQIRKTYPEKIIILGGAHATLTNPEMNLASSLIDFLVFGEGELRLPALIQAIYTKDGIDLVDGISYIKYGKVVVQPSLHVPDPQKGHMVRAVSPYTLPYFIAAAKRNEMILPASRGCPWSANSCDFCSVGKQYCDSYRKFPFNLWSADIRTVHEQTRICHIELEDENSAFAAKQSEPYLPFLKSLGITSHLHMRSDQLSRPDHLRWLANMGIKRIHVGIESGNPRILDQIMHKNENLEGHLIAARNMANAGIEIVATYIIANPTETWEEIKDTLNLAEKISHMFPKEMHRATIYILAALPGAQIYNTIEQMHIFNAELHDAINELQKNGNISKETIAKLGHWHKLPHTKSEMKRNPLVIKGICAPKDLEHQKVADSIQDYLARFLLGEIPLTKLCEESQKWNWPIPKTMEEWTKVSASYNPSLPTDWNAIYTIAGLHFNKHHKTAQNFPGWKRIIIYPFELIADIRYKFKYFKLARLEIKLIDKLLKWASKKSTGEKLS